MMNIFLFYQPINALRPNCFSNSYITVKQTVKGILGVIDSLIPCYEDENEKKEDNNK